MKSVVLIFVLFSSVSFGQMKSHGKEYRSITSIAPIKITEVNEMKITHTLSIPIIDRLEALAGPIRCPSVSKYEQGLRSRKKNDQREFNTASKRTFTRDEIESMPQGW